MGPGQKVGGTQDSQPQIPLWLTMQRCRGIGWMYSSHGGCLGLSESGRGAAVFSRVVLVRAGEEPQTTHSASAVVGGGDKNSSSADGVSTMQPKRKNESVEAALRVLDDVVPVEVEASNGEAAQEERHGEAESLFAALISPSIPEKEVAKEAVTVQGEFVVMHHMSDVPPAGEEGIEELHLCFGELLWHPMPPRLFACRSLWASPQLMQLTKSMREQNRTAPSTPTAGVETFFVLTDVEDGDAGEQSYDSADETSATAAPLAALRNLRWTIGNRETLHRIACDTLSLSLCSLRQAPATIARLTTSTAEVLQKASSDWAAFGTAAIHAAADAGERLQRFWKSTRWRQRSGDDNGSENKTDGTS